MASSGPGHLDDPPALELTDPATVLGTVGPLVELFGGIAKCDLIAEALVKAGREVGFKVPVVVRLEGTNVEKAREILAGVRGELPMIQTAANLTEAAQKAVAAAR